MLVYGAANVIKVFPRARFVILVYINPAAAESLPKFSESLASVAGANRASPPNKNAPNAIIAAKVIAAVLIISFFKVILSRKSKGLFSYLFYQTRK